MKKSLFTLILVFIGSLVGKADITADWKIHMPFDAWPKAVVNTPARTYFMSGTFEYQRDIPSRAFSSNTLFYYDKNLEEILSVNESANANGNAVSCIGFNNPDKFLLVVYTDCNMDFLYDDGRLFNLQALKASSIPGKKVVNHITFDPVDHLAYLATSFGYVTVDYRKHEVVDSRNYGIEVQSIAGSGDYVMLCHNNELYYAPVKDKRFNFSDFTKIEGTSPANVVQPLNNGVFLSYSSDGQTDLCILRPGQGGFTSEVLASDPRIFNCQEIFNGFSLGGNVIQHTVLKDGTYYTLIRPNEEWLKPVTSFEDGHWSLTERKGLRHYRFNDNKWQQLKDYMRPNAPAVYAATSFYYHPTYGMLAGSNGVDVALSEMSQLTPSNISALKGGFWKEYGLPYTNPDRFVSIHNYSGLAVDPQNTNYVYRTSATGGLLRQNLSNPDDVLIFANPSNRNASCQGFVKVVEDQQSWNVLCRFSVPQFTSDGTMWTLYNNRDAERAELWYWSAADRAATTSAASYRPMKKINMPAVYPSGNYDVMTTLKAHSTMVAFGGMQDGGYLMIYDHKGTPGTTSDDRYVMMTEPYDQDGGSVSFLVINALAEDPATGLLYIMTQRGLFTVNPSTVFDNPNQVNRIKVARNDGTNLADYLLNEINVNHMSIDNEGRKWFSTSNGLICTSSDCRSILAEFTSANSYLPSDNVYATCYNPENNSIMVATEGGLIEMFPSGSGGSGVADSEFRVYPNPVEPDFYGWVRIDNLPDGYLVKITDSRGGIVKELGPVQGGSVQWDVSGLNNNRVSTGVYYIMASPGNGGGKSQVQKILVLN